ncbi:serine hydrolase domain-containing protein [Singulisphaera acidiphila]|uniref:Penicillin-binding protein, beta-lactamase class C n=1 Tax=Singulisphaera acidiphila (strain ATCC BAA-1392 / DSM 18658 / VKM B-2454 / MOB10) TaxID=886293 RepID=L0D8H9_SINAD|nr:serine hydrolase domain-containing protein [Singulisphaera acidiphila]AGA24926.1 penicillin-binding protein, beta-lactamase class C [Singulisphaera acidiphila DSM 18658]
MVKRRAFLGEVTLGIAAYGASVGRVFAAQAAGDKPAPSSSTSPVEEPAVPRASEAIDRVLAPIREQYHLPGLVGGLVQGDRLESIGVAGVRKLGSPALFRVTDQVHIGSDTKAMTATMIGSLVDEGKLSWGATFAEVFPDQAKKMDAGFRGVTLWDLLTHRAGLPANSSWWLLGAKRSTTEQRRVLMAAMLQNAPLTKPGTKFAYSNVGYALAGLMAEQVTGQSWETLMRKRLFEPLKMTSAGFGPPGTKGEVDQPWGHEPNGKSFQPQQKDNVPAMGPAGTVHCTLADWAQFAILHLQAARGKPRLLKAATFEKLQTPPAGAEYAGGWLVIDRPWAGGPALTHSGSNTMWYATLWIAPKRDFAVLAATNAGGEEASKACDAAITGLIEHHRRLGHGV